MRWTPELDDMLLRCRAHGVSYKVIADRVGRLVGEPVGAVACQDRAKALRDTGRMPPADSKRWSPAMDAKLRQMVERGLPYSLVAKEVSSVSDRPISRNAAIGRAKRLGLCIAMVSPEVKRERVRRTASRQAAARKAAASRRLKEFARASMQSRIAAAEEKMPKAALPEPGGDLPPLVASLTDLEPHHCRWAIGDRGPYQFCGREKLAGTSWCIAHARRVFSAPVSTVAKVSVETAGKPVRKVA